MDNQVNSVDGTTSAKCPNCAANIFYNEKAGKLVCNMCGGLFAPESLKPLGRIETRDTFATTMHACNSCSGRDFHGLNEI